MVSYPSYVGMIAHSPPPTHKVVVSIDVTNKTEKRGNNSRTGRNKRWSIPGEKWCAVTTEIYGGIW